ncbi:MAG: bifunctional UDP-N-acetylmuramoyl-tripeptide:D-alanyl-D-alanine ligase/alanine racemase [Thermaurantimonas sp.]
MITDPNHPKPYSPAEIALILEAEVIGPIHTRRCIHHLWTDTRQTMPAGESLFFCLKGPHFDAHDFLHKAIENGMLYAVVERLPDNPAKNVVFFKVQNTLHSLQTLAAHHRRNLSGVTVVGITGSNGKTMVKEWLYDLLSPEYEAVKSPMSFNSQVGVPLSVWKIELRHRFAIIEAGISREGEMERLMHIIRPDIGIFTYLGSAHDAGFADRTHKLKEKSILFETSHSIIISTRQPEVLNFFQKHHSTKQLVTIGLNGEEATYAFMHIRDDLFQIKHAGQVVKFVLPFIDPISVTNSVAAIAAALHITSGDKQILRKTSVLSSVKMRMEWTRGINDCMILNDSYTADPEALVLALQTLFSTDVSRPKIIVLSEFEQLREDTSRPFTAIIESEIQHHRDSSEISLYFIGTRSAHPYTSLHGYKRSFGSTQEIIDYFKIHPPTHSDILLKGARRFEFEKIAQSLSANVHETRLEINLSAIGRNISYFRSRVGTTTRIMAVVKAASYGSGSVELARYLTTVGVDYLAVAYADEGIELRKAKIPLPVMVMNVHPLVLPLLIQHDLEPEIFSFEQLEKLKHITPSREIKIHLKLDTGMKRLGFEIHEIDRLIRVLHELRSSVRVVSILSHLAAADESEHRNFTLSQIELFHQMAEQIENTLGYNAIRHIHNSAGSLDYFDTRCRMIRIGIGMFGIAHSKKEENHLQPAVEWYSFISQIKEVKPGESVGYGRAFLAEQPLKSATVAVGYADGIRRTLSNGRGGFYVRGHYCPIIGRVCMDMTMIDVSHVPNIKADDPVEIIGPNQSLQVLARQMGVIPYEVLTSVGQRVRRVYYRE